MFFRLSAAAMITLATAGQLLAQSETFKPDKLVIKKDVSTMIEWGIASVFVVGCLVIAFKPAKRANLK